MTQPDSIIPDPYNPQDWNRYSYARYNPIRYSDPTGHAVSDGSNQGGCSPQTCPNVIPITPPAPNNTYVPVMTPNQGLQWVANPPKDPTPISDLIKQIPFSSEDWALAGTVTDGVVFLLDLYADGVVAYATIYGIGAGLPVIVVVGGEAIALPALTGVGAFLAADFFIVKPILRLGNWGASAATVCTYISETKSGATVIEKGQISNATKNSFVLTVSGWVAPEAITSTIIQGSSLANDLGWISFPFR
jgi:hypothetical protein